MCVQWRGDVPAPPWPLSLVLQLLGTPERFPGGGCRRGGVGRVDGGVPLPQLVLPGFPHLSALQRGGLRHARALPRSMSVGRQLFTFLKPLTLITLASWIPTTVVGLKNKTKLTKKTMTVTHVSLSSA